MRRFTRDTNRQYVTSIENYAFEYCSSLINITLPNRVTYIGDGAFENCYRLVEIYNKSSLNIEKGSTENGSVGYYAKNIYTTTKGLSKISVQNDEYIIYTEDDNNKILIKYIGNAKFLILPNNINEIYRSAFESCYTLINIIISDSVTSIGENAFDFCINLTSVTIGNGITFIDNSAFKYCYKLVEVYNKSPLKITKGSTDNGEIGYYAKSVYTAPYTSKLFTDENGYTIYIDSGDRILMSYIGNKTDIILPTNITKIYQYAFYDNFYLTSIAIPDSVVSIGDYAFFGCDNLSNMIIPNKVTNIGKLTFYHCNNLTSVTFENTNGWKAGNTSISSTTLVDTATAAQYLTKTYFISNWTRSE